MTTNLRGSFCSLWRGLAVDLEEGVEDGRLPVVLTLADVADVDRMLAAVDNQDGSIPAEKQRQVLEQRFKLKI